MKNYLQSVEGTEKEHDDSVKEAKWLLSVLNQYMSNCAKYRNVYITPRNGQEAIQKAETEVSLLLWSVLTLEISC